MRLASLDPQGAVAAEIADLWWILLAIGGAVFVLFLVVLFRGLTRVSPPGGGINRAQRGGGGRILLIGGGVVLPSIVVAVVFALTLIAMRSLPIAGSSERLVVEITGYQWWWDVVYPGQRIRTANEMYVPVGEEVELVLLSVDVVHSFWVPAVAGKTDLLPDRPTSMVIEAGEAGNYRGVCAEFCGLQHARMAFTLVAVDEAQFADWLETQSQPAPAPATDESVRGREVFLESGCANCHRIDGTSTAEIGPDLTHLASRLTLAAGTFPNTADHLRNWVSRPQELKEGVAMEDIALSADDLDSLIVYLESLE